MLIAISQRNDQNKHGDFIDCLENSYVNYLKKFGIELLVVPNSVSGVEYYFNSFPIEGVILSGGNDIDPELYGTVRGENDSFSVMRDKTEQKMLELAVEKKIPVLGICRGMQMINVYFDGKLVNLNENEKTHPIEHHYVKVVDSTKEILGNESIVNSYHNFGVSKETLSPQLKMFATSKDEKVIEGIYHPDFPIAGIQWHPERSSPDSGFNEKLMKAFVDRELFWEKKERKTKAIILAAGMGTRLWKYT